MSLVHYESGSFYCWIDGILTTIPIGSSSSSNNGLFSPLAIDGLDGNDNFYPIPGPIGISGLTGTQGLRGIPGIDSEDSDSDNFYPLIMNRSPQIGPFTAGSVIFSNGLNLVQDNPNFFYDDALNRFGLGTTAPDSRLHINETGGQSYFHITDGVNERFIVASNARVGIGILVPLHPLHILKATDAYISLETTAANADVGFLFNNSGDAAGWALWRHESGYLHFSNSVGAIYPSGTLATHLTLSINGVLGLGVPNAAFPTGTMGLIFGDGTALSSMGSNTTGVYGNDVGGTVKMHAIDEAGSITRLNHTPRALGVGIPATLGTIGSTGPTVAAQNQWMEYSVNGTTYFIPVWV